MTEVAPTRTPSDAPTVAGAFVWAYRQVMGRDPPRQESWLYPLALSALETAHWTNRVNPQGGMFNWNTGNVTTANLSNDWYRNPNVTVPLKFRSFPNLGFGAIQQINVLKHMGALAAADDGDYDAFMQALQTGGYAGRGVAYPSLSATIDALRSTVPVPYAPPETAITSPGIARSTPWLAAFGVGALALALGALARTLDARVPA